MHKSKYAFAMPSFIIAFLSTSAYGSDLTLQCDGVIRRLGGAYVRKVSVQLELFWNSGRYVLYERKQSVRARLGEGEDGSE